MKSSKFKFQACILLLVIPASATLNTVAALPASTDGTVTFSVQTISNGAQLIHLKMFLLSG